MDDLEPINGPPLHHWLTEPLPPDVCAALQRARRADDVQYMAVMPDVHLASDVCNGCVMATCELIYPDAVGGDIGCGMAGAAFDCEATLLSDERRAARVLKGLYETVPLNRHRRRTGPGLPAELHSAELGCPQLNALKHREAGIQFGTLGGGNHFLEFQRDEKGQLWLMVHTGSRGMGQAIRAAHLDAAPATAGGLRRLACSDAAGQAYLSDADWAVRYACRSREAILLAVDELMRGLFGVRVIMSSIVNVDHNHVRREEHHGRELWVHRKGAMFAGLDAPGVIPGSMGSASYHVLGRGCPDSLLSSSHGAGRAMSREQARRRIRPRDAERAMADVWFDRRRLGRLIEESPGAYKDIHKVMRAQRDLTRVVRTLYPVLCYKGT